MQSRRIAALGGPILIMGVSAALMLGSVGHGNLSSQVAPARTTHGIFDQGPFSDDSPLGPDGMKTTLAGATSSASFHVARPNDSDGSDTSVTAAWVRTGQLPEVVIHYRSGLEAYVTPWTNSQTPSDFYQEQIREGVPGTPSLICSW